VDAQIANIVRMCTHMDGEWKGAGSNDLKEHAARLRLQQ